MSRIAARFLQGAAALGGAIGLGLAAQAAEPPETLEPDASCITSQCHGEYQGRSYPHWDFEDFQEECTDCHEQEGKAHEFSLEETPSLCHTCHDSFADAEFVHEPAEEDCLDCHDPHGSETPGMLVAKSQKRLCFECHDAEDVLEDEFTHTPAKKGDCTGCHDPHASAHASLLRASGSDLCLGCHEELAEQIETAAAVHDPAEDDCTDCHAPHSSSTPGLLLADSVEALCDECHDDVVSVARGAPVGHDAVLEGDQCLSCHSPHAADHDPLLLQPEIELCLGCHDRQLASDSGRLIDMREKLEASPEWHEPIREEGCTACHEPHGSRHFRLLKKAFPARFYTPFDTDSYALCFSCHEEATIVARRTRTATGFRDGDRNLHFVHVNREQKGRSCRACHDPHANGLSTPVAETIRFGRWLMPLEFDKTETGGSCQSSCHPSESYDREARVGPPGG